MVGHLSDQSTFCLAIIQLWLVVIKSLRIIFYSAVMYYNDQQTYNCNTENQPDIPINTKYEKSVREVIDTKLKGNRVQC